MSLMMLLEKAKPTVEEKIVILAGSWPKFTLFLSVSDGQKRAQVVHCSGDVFADVWQQLTCDALALVANKKITPQYLRLDWIKSVRETSLGQLTEWLKNVKRNYFRYGLALDAEFNTAFLEQELNSNAMLYGGNEYAHVIVNQKNFDIYAKKRYQSFDFDFDEHAAIYMLDTEGVFCSTEEPCTRLYAKGRDAGRRIIEEMSQQEVLGLIKRSSHYLTTQVQDTGQFYYGWHPCFDRHINTYNTLRHASTTYSMVEAWEVTQEPELKKAILRSFNYMINTLIKQITLKDQDKTLAFLVEHNNKEIKLGANAVCILALSKYSEVTGSKEYLGLLEQLALGIEYMQNKDTGKFIHVLNYPKLTVKDEFRIIYYDGEAAFGLMRLYGLTKDQRWLNIVEKAFDYFIAAEHWQAHDHWLSYCVNELTLYRPDERYYKFGLQNVMGYLDFVTNRITTFPTLLELMMAAELMITRLQSATDYQYLLEDIALDKFYFALEKRAHYLLNGHFWPEYAMYFAKPNKILGSFFIRHHSFRVRIDDVEHYLSGFVAYLKYLKNKQQLLSEQSHVSQLRRPKSLASVKLQAQQQSVVSKRIGYLCYPKTPRHFLEVNEIAMQAHTRNLELVYFSYNDFSCQGDKIKGYLYNNGNWELGYYSLPDIIDNAPANNKVQRVIYDNLLEASNLLCRPLGGKSKTLSLIYNSKKSRDVCIPSIDFSFVDLMVFLEENNKAILKHKRSSQGKKIYLVEKVRGNYILRSDELTVTLTESALEKKLNGFTSVSWMVQKYIESTTPEQGRPFDVRVTVYRQNENDWVVANPYVRVGQSGITSNLATGGNFISSAENFLQNIYPNKSKQIVSALVDKAITIATELQQGYDFKIDALGCDFGIEDGKLFLFEVNSYPGIKGYMKQAAQLKVNYYVSYFN